VRVVQVVPQIGFEASGPSYSVRALCEAISEQGVEVALHVLQQGQIPAVRGVQTETHEIWPHPIRRMGPSPSMRRALAQAARQSDILHSHGLWMFPNVYPAWAVRGTDCRLVLSPRGTLAPAALARSPFVKRVFWTLQREVISRAACLHATSNNEYDQIRAFGVRAPVAVIPNGIDLPGKIDNVRIEGGRQRMLFLGRLHPIKGIDLLLQAWRQVQGRFDNWELRLVGPDEGGYGERMKRLAAELGAERVSFGGPAFGAQKWAEYAASDLFVLPTHTENFGMSVVEALAAGVPVIVTKGAPWSELPKQGCGWWIDIGTEPLVECLDNVLRIPKTTLAEMGGRGREWVRERYGWARIGKMMVETYQWILNGGGRPEWVHVE